MQDTPELRAHEALCTRCGTSCHYGVPVNGLPVVVDDLHCRYLARQDDGRFGCTVYERRFEVAPWCATVEQGLRDGLLGQSCGYVRAARAQSPDGMPYKGKTRLHPRLEAKVLPAIREELLTNGAPVGISAEGLKRFMDRTGGGEFDVTLEGSRLWLRPCAEAAG